MPQMALASVVLSVSTPDRLYLPQVRKPELLTKKKNQKWRSVYFSCWNIFGTMTRSIVTGKIFVLKPAGGGKIKSMARSLGSF